MKNDFVSDMIKRKSKIIARYGSEDKMYSRFRRGDVYFDDFAWYENELSRLDFDIVLSARYVYSEVLHLGKPEEIKTIHQVLSCQQLMNYYENNKPKPITLSCLIKKIANKLNVSTDDLFVYAWFPIIPNGGTPVCCDKKVADKFIQYSYKDSSFLCVKIKNSKQNTKLLHFTVSSINPNTNRLGDLMEIGDCYQHDPNINDPTEDIKCIPYYMITSHEDFYEKLNDMKKEKYEEFIKKIELPPEKIAITFVSDSLKSKSLDEKIKI